MQELKFHGTNVKKLLKIISTVDTDRKIFESLIFAFLCIFCVDSNCLFSSNCSTFGTAPKKPNKTSPDFIHWKLDCEKCIFGRWIA